MSNANCNEMLLLATNVPASLAGSAGNNIALANGQGPEKQKEQT